MSDICVGAGAGKQQRVGAREPSGWDALDLLTAVSPYGASLSPCPCSPFGALTCVRVCACEGLARTFEWEPYGAPAPTQAQVQTPFVEANAVVVRLLSPQARSPPPSFSIQPFTHRLCWV